MTPLAGTVTGIGRSLGAGARDAVDGVSHLIAVIEKVTTGIAAIETEMRGMRSDMREVIEGVEGLRNDLTELTTEVAAIRAATTGLEQQVGPRLDAVGRSLHHIDSLAARFPRLSGARAAAAVDAGVKE
jgi:hypothetical protein